MCGLTLLPRNALPTIFLVLMSMNAMSFESRLTIITTDVGSATLTPAALQRRPRDGRDADDDRDAEANTTMRLTLIHDVLLTPMNRLESSPAAGCPAGGSRTSSARSAESSTCCSVNDSRSRSVSRKL